MDALGGAGSGLGGGDLGVVSWLELFFMLLPPLSLSLTSCSDRCDGMIVRLQSVPGMILGYCLVR